LKKLLLIILACYNLNAEAQVNESQNFVYLYSDSVIYARNIRLRTNFVNSRQLRVDSKPTSLKQVKFFKNDEGFFANTSKLSGWGAKKGLAERVIEGRINLFQERTYRTFFSGGQYMHHNAVVDVRMFYNKGYDDLKKVNYKNLKVDMADNVESLDLLENYRKSVKTSKSLYITAGATAAAALISFIVNAKNNEKSLNANQFNNNPPSLNSTRPNFTSSFVLLGISTGLAAGGYFVNESGLKKLEGAVDSYNR